MATIDLIEWINTYSKPNIYWYIKRLSANDTLANGTHQAGPYIPKEILFSIFPELDKPELENPEVRFNAAIDSHMDFRTVRAVWYNNKNRGGTRNETRLTNFGGSSSPLLDPESTGALTVFAFDCSNESQSAECHIWVCNNEIEEDLFEDKIGPVEPGKWKLWSYDKCLVMSQQNICKDTICCRLSKTEMPESWLTNFPSGDEIIQKVIELRPLNGQTPDLKIIKRRECEYELFQSIEECHTLPIIKQGFSSINEFINCAQTVLQRRKARSGRSLELHTFNIFEEEGLRHGIDFSHQPESEKGKRPDFIFPSQKAYHNIAFSSGNLRMLAVKTTCKDRWRQILNEADRIKVKHLFTLQEGLSINQFNEMKDANVKLVVPASLIKFYPTQIQSELQTLESFIGDIRLLNL